MGSNNQLALVIELSSQLKPPFLEVGSKAYDDVERVSSLFEGQDFTGIDMIDGDNVDYVIDLTQDFDDIDRELKGKRFRSIFCLSVLEHCENPFDMARNLTRLLEDDGTIYVSVPYSWKFHGYPSDYWRFTHEGVKKLFPDIDFPEEKTWISSDVDGDIRLLKDKDLGRIRLNGSWLRKKGMFWRGIGADIMRVLGAVGLFKWLTQHRYLVPPIMIDMVGSRRRD